MNISARLVGLSVNEVLQAFSIYREAAHGLA